MSKRPWYDVATMTLLTDGPTLVWVGGAMAFERAVNFSSCANGAILGTVELAAGWNPVLVKVVTSGATHRIGLQFSGELLR